MDLNRKVFAGVDPLDEKREVPAEDFPERSAAVGTASDPAFEPGEIRDLPGLSDALPLRERTAEVARQAATAPHALDGDGLQPQDLRR